MRKNTIQVSIHALKKHKTLKFGVSDILKLKKVVVANIVCLHLTLIIVCFCGYTYSILNYTSNSITIAMKLYKNKNNCSIL